MARRRGERGDLCARAQDECATRSGSASSAGDWSASRCAAPRRAATASARQEQSAGRRLGKSKVPAGLAALRVARQRRFALAPADGRRPQAATSGAWMRTTCPGPAGRAVGWVSGGIRAALQ